MQFPYVCLYCSKEFKSRVRATKHSCAQKREAEQRLGVKLATYDPLIRGIEIERLAEANGLENPAYVAACSI